MLFVDALQIGQPRRTKEGYLAVRARSARTGVYQYSGRQVDPENRHGLRDAATVNVLRDEGTVFDKRAAQSFIGKPITVDHPAEAVTSANWKDHSRGAIMGALRDGDYLAFDLLLMDKTAIDDVEAGKRELSNGYAAELEFGDFTAPDGTKCPVRQSQITDGNHIAIVDAGRAGPECRISDGGNVSFAVCDAATLILDTREREPAMKIKIGDSEVDATNGEAVRIAVDALNAKLADAQAQVGTLTADLASAKAAVETKDGELAVINAKLKDATDPAKQAARDAARARVIVGAQMLKPGITVDARPDADIRKEAVEASIGDAAKDMSDAAIEGAFAALTKDAKPTGQRHDPIRMPVGSVTDNSSVRDLARMAQY
jgi:uncharacterized protein